MRRPALPVDFLFWLERYVGVWKYDGRQYTVGRRGDGWLCARGPEHELAPLAPLLGGGKRIQAAPSPLGVYPVCISQYLMELWLKPDEMERLREAWRVSRGMKLIVETIERNIRECDEATRRRRFAQIWLAGRDDDDPWTDDDSAVYGLLRAEHKAAASASRRFD